MSKHCDHSAYEAEICVGTFNDIDKLEKLYDDLNTYFEVGFNYPGWLKGIYPVRNTAEVAISGGNLFILKVDHKIAGSIILNQKEETAYSQATWSVEAEKDDLIVIHTLVVHPNYRKNRAMPM